MSSRELSHTAVPPFDKDPQIFSSIKNSQYSAWKMHELIPINTSQMQ